MKLPARLRAFLQTLVKCAAVFDLRDAHAYCGLTMIGLGLAMNSPAAALTLCGLLIFWMGVR